ncbi:Stp1/IreP family PP2C-type Ser/Thr phosphatase [Jeotgalibacillus soli]|uniref:protein-serine/threonine phosphatase n=1 Tax=Jeotgalibacillus soli TaxID=889306 RepID=A0A0C2RSV3_9BACL|nr:Stp1/IreP family PP2C-type Ser/Thr phosphatase [Jeotgalibacillus soli]KIL44839.1 protein phosphatase [Jeotgalibacillus soli]
MQFAFLSDQGMVRKLNEDSGGVYPHPLGYYLAVVADGMGGHRAGDVASAMAVRLLEEYWREIPPLKRPTEAEEWLSSSIESINEKLYSHAANHEECEGMGTTIVAAICTKEFITLGNVGDSRGYIWNNERIRQITEDHSFVNALVQSGEISREDAEHHPNKNLLLKALGSEGKIKPDVRTIEFEQGDLVLLCSDGLSNKITEAFIEEIMINFQSLDERAKQLIEKANSEGGEDNITIAMVEFSPVVESEGI